MRKSLLSAAMITSLLLTPYLRSQDPTPLATTPVESTVEEEGTPVGQASSEGSKTAKKRIWQNIALAVGTVAIAVTALILVSSNEGHHKKKHHD